ncbi:MAG: hypothetical protein ABSA33_02580 [Candidatus Micrarchaeaceae archaeon]|jgi:hypothetical protein
MVRPRTISEGAKRTTIYLDPVTDVALNLIENSRRLRKEKRYQPNHIVADAIWFYLEKVEGKTRQQLEALLPAPQDRQETNLKEFPKKGKKPS